MKFLVLHKLLTSEENKKESFEVGDRIGRDKQEYCIKHGYEYHYDETPYVNTHWNEDYWAHIPVIVDVLNTKQDIDWLFFMYDKGIIDRHDILLEDMIKGQEDKNLIFGYMDFQIKNWYSLEEEEAVDVVFDKHMHRIFLSRCVFVKNCEESKKWLLKIYNDKRFTIGSFGEDVGRVRDPFRTDGHHLVDQAHTLYYENYSEFRDMIGLLAMYEIASVVKPINLETQQDVNRWASRFPHKTAKSHLEGRFLKFLTCSMDPNLLFTGKE